MANYATLKAAIQEVVRTNANNEITGALLQQSLLSMINSLGANYQFAGVATPTTTPGTPDQNVFYIAGTAGTYSNFNAIVINKGELAILKYNGTWTKEITGGATNEQILQLEQQTNVVGVGVKQLSRYIRYSDGVSVGSGSYFELYKFDVTGLAGKTVIAKLACRDKVPAMIAFYSANEINNANYISGVQSVAAPYARIHEYTATIPENAVLMVCTNRNDDLPNPYISMNVPPLPQYIYDKEKNSNLQYISNAFLFPISSATSKSNAITLGETGEMRFSFIPLEDVEVYRMIFNCSSAQNPFMGVTDSGQVYFNFGGAALYTRVYLTKGVPTTWKITWDATTYHVENDNGYTADVAYSQSVVGRVIQMYTKTNSWNLITAQWLEATYNGNSFLFTEGFTFGKSQEMSGIQTTLAQESRKALELYNPFTVRLYHHLNVEQISAIPAQSLFDITYAKSLGFNAIEANVQTCSDGVFVCKHGRGGNLGDGLIFADGSGLSSTTPFSSVSSSALRQNVTYDTPLERYRGHIPTLDEFAAECKRVGMKIFAGITRVEQLQILRKYLPDEMIIAYGYPARGDFRGLIYVYGEPSSAEASLTILKTRGVPAAWGATYANMTDAAIQDFCKALHDNGFLAMAAYLSGNNINRLAALGVDVFASTSSDVPYFEIGQKANIHDISGFQVSQSVVIGENQTQMPNGSSIWVVDNDFANRFGKASLRILFSGSLTVEIGGHRTTIANDGTHYVWLAYEVSLRSDILTITATEATIIQDIHFATSIVM